MPYIVKTLVPNFPAEAGHAVTRRAIGTPEEAQEFITEECLHHGRRGDGIVGVAASDVSAVVEIGGTVGPLPDGAVLKIQLVTWEELAHDERSESWPDAVGSGVSWPQAHAAILDAYNAHDEMADEVA